MQKKIPLPFASRADVDAYLNGEDIECLLCGRRFLILSGKHLKSIHGVTSNEYRKMFCIPAGRGLAGSIYRKQRSDIARNLHNTGRINANPKVASDAARASGRGQRVAWDISEQAERAAKIDRPQIPPGSKRADGRDALRAREYQRKYRSR
ncbi:MucR family transcriptional regulator [Acetobacter oryzoeni]|uniref:MucR family transcriptional regulator n=1 Tax=Acetobacter oryzoeni TaxID=2500548 RepID=A0A5B9GMQ5_9PROT|nr:hypothetical protein EOV40_009715 [Acetobacter oryzoeni]